MRILHSCVVLQDSILKTEVCASQSSHTLSMLFHYSYTFTTRIRKDISAASFCSGKLLGRSDECILLFCFESRPNIFAVMKCKKCRRVEFIFLRYSNLERCWFIFSPMTHKLKGVCVEEYAYCVNKFRQIVGLDTWTSRQTVTSQTAHTKYKWPPYANEWNPPTWKFSACATVWMNN